MKKTISQHKRIITYLFLFGMGIVQCLPEFLITGIQQFPYHDGAFHISRIIGLSNVWRSPVNFLNFHHNGLMINICYPWLTMYPAYIFYKIFGGYVTAYKVYYLFLTILTLFLAYDVMYDISGNWLSSFSFSVLYSFCSYRFATIYNRSALGEVIAMTIWLLVFLGIYHVFFSDTAKWPCIAAGMALLSYTHNLSLLIASVIIGLMLLLSFWFWDHKRQRFFALVKAASTAGVLSLGSLVPMFRLFRTDELSIPGGSGQWLEESVYAVPEMLRRAFRNETTSHTVGLLVITAFFCLVLFYAVRIIRKPQQRSDRGMDFIAFFGILVLFCVTDLLPWRAIGEHTLLRSLQFAWRFNTCSTLFILAAFSFYLPEMIPSGKKMIWIQALICVAAVGLHYSAKLSILSQDSSRILEKDVAAGDIISMDYAPLQAREYRREKGLPALEGILIDGKADPDPENVLISADGTYYIVTIEAPASEEKTQSIDLPVFRYSTQDCTLNGEKITTSMSERGGTLVEIPSGRTSEIRIFYRYTTLARISQAVSGIAALLFALFLVRKHKKTAGRAA